MNLKRLRKLARRGPAWAPIAPLVVFGVIVLAVLGAVFVSNRSDDLDENDGDVVEFVTEEVDRGAPTTGGALVVANPASPTTLNMASRAGNTRLVRQLMMPVTGENLLTLSADFTYQPQLAEAVPNAGDGTLINDPFTVRFTLRDGVAWSDGTPMTSADVRFTWQTMRNPDNLAAGQAGWMAIADVRTPSDREVEIEFARPYPEWRALFSASGSGGVLLPKHILAGRDFNTAWKDENPIGTGPFVVGEFRKGVGLVLVRNVRYWNGEADGPHLDQIVHRFMADGDAAEEQFLGAGADIVELRDFSRYDQLAATPGATVLTGPSATIEMLTFNSRDPVVGDIRVRQALIAAIDRLALAADLPAAPPPAQSVVPAQFGASYLPAFANGGVDLDATERLLEEAGYSRAESAYYQDRETGEELDIEILAPEDNPSRRAYLVALAEQLDESGIATTVRFVKDFRTPLSRGRFQIAASAREIDPEPQIIGFFASRFIPRAANEFSGLNYSRISDRRFDRLRAKLATETSAGARSELLREVQRVAADTSVVLPLFQWPTVLAVGPAASGVALNPSAATSFSTAASWYTLIPDRDLAAPATPGAPEAPDASQEPQGPADGDPAETSPEMPIPDEEPESGQNSDIEEPEQGQTPAAPSEAGPAPGTVG